MNNFDSQKNKFAFFGTDNFSVGVLEELKTAEIIPSLIITAPDRPSGRGQKINEPEAKKWAKENNIDFLQPEKLDEDFIEALSKKDWSFFTVASYGKIIPKEVVEMPKHKSLNVHPSLLPLYRGASPIESAILDDMKETGVTIMLMDEKMDHGPILNQEFVQFDEWPPRLEVEEKLAQIGGKLLADTIPLWLNDDIEEQEQDHESATFTQKITKEMGEIKFSDIEKVMNGQYDEKIGREVFLKVQALNPWPGVFFFYKHGEKEIRVKITKASFVGGKLKIEAVVPEDKKEMGFESFLRGY